MQSMSTTLPQEQLATHSKAQPWIVCFSAALFFFYEFIQMHMFNAVSADLMRDFSIDATQLGNLSAIYFYSNVLFLLFSGVILDRFSTRRVILITLSLCAIGIGTFALTHSLVIAGISRFISGIGSAFCFLSSIRLASRWFPAKRMALVSGLIVTMAMTGGMVAQTIAHQYADKIKTITVSGSRCHSNKSTEILFKFIGSLRKDNVPRAGHAMMAEQPELFAKTVVEFLQKN